MSKNSQASIAVRTEGGLLPGDLLDRVRAGESDIDGLSAEAYHLSGVKLNEEISRSWSHLLGSWKNFQETLKKLPESDPGTTVTREKWLLPLFQQLGYGRLPANQKAQEIEGKSYPISHAWQNIPIHLVGCRLELDRRTPKTAGAAQMSPHSLVQEFLNRAPDRLWGFLSNGMRLRVLRNNLSLTRQSFVEFDLESIMVGELYSDFVLLWLCCHESRVDAPKPSECWLERWVRAARERGTRALDDLRMGVEKAIESLGQGFLSCLGNSDLRQRLKSGALSTQDYYRELLRLVYRVIFLFVAEDRGLLLDANARPEAQELYRAHYSAGRLRKLAEKRHGSKHVDLWRCLRLVMGKLGSPDGCPELGLAPLGSSLWSKEAAGALEESDLRNRDLLDAVRALSFLRGKEALRSIDYRNLGAEELGSIYESLLELHPEVNVDTGRFSLHTASGHERKNTGSYYTPSSLIHTLLDSALDPMLDEAARQKDPEKALLALKICDPACGSGHFLIAAAHRMARRLATWRTGDPEPAPDQIRTALRDVIGHCIYGVDLNPMAVELCKIGLWMESLNPGKPLGFLDHRIRCGNSLLGATPALLSKGIPTEAFQPLDGDEKAIATTLKKRNREELKKEAQATFFVGFAQEPKVPYGGISDDFSALDRMGEDSMDELERKAELHRRLLASREYRRKRFEADSWCASFVWSKTKEAPEAMTQAMWKQAVSSGSEGTLEEVRQEVEKLAAQYRFFHWHLAFPEVFRLSAPGESPDHEGMGWSGGFDVVLGNPPWERIKIQEKEWFAVRVPEIAGAPNSSHRSRMIEALKEENPALYHAFFEDHRGAEGESHWIRNSGKYPLCGVGDINTYAVFAELTRQLLSPRGRVGCIVPSGIATDHTTRFFFQDLVVGRSLISLYEFENEGFFTGAGQGHMLRFALVTLTGSKAKSEEAEYFFQGKDTSEILDYERRFCLTAQDIDLINPNTRTCPIFRGQKDAELTRAIYRRVPVLIREEPAQNEWGIQFLRMFDMSNDSSLFRTRAELESAGFLLKDNLFHKGNDSYLPLYEAKMVYQFSHRHGSFANIKKTGERAHVLPESSLEQLKKPDYYALPYYWVDAKEVALRLRHKWDRGWLIGWRDVTDARASARTVIASVVPCVGVGNKFVLIIISPMIKIASMVALAGNLCSFPLDYVARQKMGGITLNYFIMKQLPILPPAAYEGPCPWDRSKTTGEWILPRVLELVYTAWDLAPFARDCGYDGPPFAWDEERRFSLRCELDAAYFHLYGTTRDEAAYVLDTFPIVRRKEIEKHGEYRTRRVVLEQYDALWQAIQRNTT